MPAHRKLNAEAYQEVQDALLNYITITDDPIAAEFLANDATALHYWLTDDDLSSPVYPKLHTLMQRLLKKSEAYMLRKGMNGQSTGMSIFRLKQRWHGYTDRTEQNITSNGEKVTFNNTLPRPVNEKNKPKQTNKA